MARRLARITETVLLSGTVAALVATVIGFCGDWHWYADLFAHFRPQYVIGFALVGTILLLRRRWKTAGLALAGIVINLTVMWPHAVQSEIALSSSSPSATAVSHAKVRVVSFNLLQGNEHLEAAERFLRECDADVIILQEVTPETATMLRRCEPIYPDQFIRGKKDSKGTALLTRLPVKNLRFEPAPGEELIGANIGEFTAPNGQLFTILGVHSHKPTSAKGAAGQDKYFDWLAERITTLRQSGTSLVVAGDFNATPWSRSFKRFTAASPLLDTSRGVLFGATWNVWSPQRLLIDHVFVSPEWRLLGREVGPEAGSDHRPLIVDLALAH